MNKLKTLVISLVLIVSSGVASAISVSGNMSLTSDYIWRGMTQNDGEVAIQGGFDLETDSGFYLGTWAGSANFGGGESLELTTMVVTLVLWYWLQCWFHRFTYMMLQVISLKHT